MSGFFNNSHDQRLQEKIKTKPVAKAEPEPPKATRPEACACGSSVRWMDHFGNVHCRECKPPAVESIVAANIAKGEDPAKYGNRASDRSFTACDDQFRRYWRTYELDGRTVMERRTVTKTTRTAWMYADAQRRTEEREAEERKTGNG